MANLSENYQLRKCFLKRNQVPTISLMKKKMSPALANIYFNSMTPKLKVISGLEPPMQGGGSDWIVPPAELLAGRAVLKPFNKKHMAQWCWNGVDEIGMKLIKEYREHMHIEGTRRVNENDQTWPLKVNAAREHEWKKCSAAAQEENNYQLQQTVHTFEMLYATSLTKLQDLLLDAAVNKIKSDRKKLFQEMQVLYERLLQKQATKLYEKYTKKDARMKTKLKNKFIHDLEVARTTLGNELHDINFEKHTAVEKLRHFLESQKLACLVYLAMIERQECVKETEFSKKEHTKTVEHLTADIASKDFEILLAQKKELKQAQFETLWKKKVCHVVKAFQRFVSFCLNMIPEHAEFFTNMEKLLMLQLGEALENPKVDSIIILEPETFYTPIPKPHPFYLFCDRGYKPKLDQDLCPKHCTSSASQLPVIVVNKRCIYSACDNFEQFTDKIKDYIHGRLQEDAHFKDYHDYSRDMSVKCTLSQQLQEMKLEGSLLQILQSEITNIRGVAVQCGACKIPHCFDCDGSISSLPCELSLSHLRSEKSKLHADKCRKQPAKLLPSVYSGTKIKSKEAEFKYDKEPKLESYSKYIRPKKCECAKLARKHLSEYLPIYMRNMSTYDEPELLNYQTCSVTALKALVAESRGNITPKTSPEVQLSKTKEIGVQSSVEFDNLCTCFSDYSIFKFLNNAIDFTRLISDISSAEHECNVVGASLSSTYLSKRRESFATDRAHSLRHLIDKSSDIKEIFMKTDFLLD